MLRDNHAEYRRNYTRGMPRDGAAALQGIVWCGQCGHKMRVQYSGGNRYVCNFLLRSQGDPLCQHLPADLIDARWWRRFLPRSARPKSRPGRKREMPDGRLRKRSTVLRRTGRTAALSSTGRAAIQSG